MITLSQAETLLGRYAGNLNDFTERLNLVRERLLKAGDWRNTFQPIIFSVYPDTNYNAFVTLPSGFNTVLAGAYLNTSTGRRCGYPFKIQNQWYSFMSGGAGLQNDSRYGWGQGFIPDSGRYTTFRDFSSTVKLRFKFAAVESAGTINVRGNFNGQPVYTSAGTIEGENLTISGNTTLTTASDFDESPYSVVKPVTNGRVSLYTWDGVTETLIAIYEPDEVAPSWRRYRVPACTTWTEADPGQFLAITKRDYLPISNGNDPVTPSNIGALRFGLDALLREDSLDFERAEQSWQKAYDLLAKESEDDTGAGAESPVHVADSFMMNSY